jgi:hypothetical protein
MRDKILYSKYRVPHKYLCTALCRIFLKRRYRSKTGIFPLFKKKKLGLIQGQNRSCVDLRSLQDVFPVL